LILTIHSSFKSYLYESINSQNVIFGIFVTLSYAERTLSKRKLCKKSSLDYPEQNKMLLINLCSTITLKCVTMVAGTSIYLHFQKPVLLLTPARISLTVYSKNTMRRYKDF